MKSTQTILTAAKNACAAVGALTTTQKNAALQSMAQALITHTDAILTANRADVTAAKGNISTVMIDRLLLTKERILAMANGICEVAELPDPVGKNLSTHICSNGLAINKVSVAIGVVAIIYESRPNVTSDAAALCLKSGNVCVLRSGKEAFGSAMAIVTALQQGLSAVGITPNAIQLIEDTTRQSATDLMKANGYVDLLIPRGGPGLINACIQNATVPCIQTGTGICHIYVDASANQNWALDIIKNAKTSRPSVCNAAEVCLVHQSIAKEFLPKLKTVLTDVSLLQPVELRLSQPAQQYITGTPAGAQDFDTEFLDYILAVEIVNDVADAITHIAKHSTHHSEAIIANDPQAIDAFTSLVDSAAVYVNASTRFTDGGEFGLGCEMGISTQKMHARGPMGLQELTTYKYIITGNGQIR